MKVRRNADACVSCGLCDKACMARLPVSSSTSVWSVECTGCLDCVAVCPRKDALAVGLRGRRVSPLTYAFAVVALFAAGYAGARVAGVWDNRMSDAEYVEHIRGIRSAEYGHPGMTGPGEPASTER
jgi:NAD-dependent dihydropyrimidine dehydrogenase PreA subunit